MKWKKINLFLINLRKAFHSVAFEENVRVQKIFPPQNYMSLRFYVERILHNTIGHLEKLYSYGICRSFMPCVCEVINIAINPIASSPSLEF